METAHRFGIPTTRWQIHISCDGTRILTASGFFTAESAFRHASVYLFGNRFNEVSQFTVEVNKEVRGEDAQTDKR